MAGSNLLRYPPLLWMMFFACCGLIFIANLFQTQDYSIKSTFMSSQQASQQFSEETKLKGFLIRTPGCTIPDMRVLDPSIKKFIFEEEDVVCNNGVPALYGANRTSIYLLQSVLPSYNISEMDSLTCCYQTFKRINPKRNTTDNSIKFDPDCVKIKNGSATIVYEFIRVKCYYNNTIIYRDYFDFVPVKTPKTNHSSLNVLVIGIDAVSRLNFHRQMPKTARYLDKIGSVEMLGYNKVGDNTFPNLIPILTGLSEDELTGECWPNQDAYFDKCPFIWNDYAARGFTTGFGEDSSWMGIFYYQKKGFYNQPTHHFWDPFDSTAGNEIGNQHRLNVDQCLGARALYKVLLDYVENYAITLLEAHRPFFGFFWGASLSHDFLNKPRLGDDDYFNMLQSLNASGVLNNTALIVLSDHGIRWGDIRSTYQGRMEERLPFLYIGLPHWYRMQHSKLYINLKQNRRRLTTPFDLHETLKDLINSSSLSDEFINNRNQQLKLQRGYSLFDAITLNRTCDDANISSHWCTCQTSKRINIDDNVVIEVANYTINEYINELLVGYAGCATLELDEILDARIQLNTNDVMRLSHARQDYSIMFKTRPGGAIFEATVSKYNTHNANDYHFNVTGTVSRLNLYGQQSKCITDFHLKLYCFCKQFLSDT